MPVVDGEYQAPELPIPGPTVAPEPVEPTPAPQPAPDESPFQKTLVETLKGLTERVSDNVSNTALIADPNIRAYLEMKQKGLNPEIVAKKVTQEPATPEEPKLPDNIEDMGNADFTKFILSSINKSLDTHLKNTVAQQIGALREELTTNLGSKVNDLLALEGNRLQSKAQEEIAAVKAKYSDFESIKPEMAKLASVTQGISAEELYHLAKMRMGVPPVTQQQISTERPGTVPGSQTAQPRTSRTPLPPGPQGFKMALANVLNARYPQQS